MQRLELTWIGKGQEPEVEPRILLHDPSKDYGDPNSENMLIHGDNLLALKALEQQYAGQVKCIYIDPPYNTGNEGWVYNDNVNDPKIREGLGEMVGKEGEELAYTASCQ